METVGVLEPSRNVLSYKWKVNNYSDYNYVGQCLKSPVFSSDYSSGGTQWCLNLYPKGTQWPYKDYLSMFVEYLGETNVTAHVTIGILDVEQNFAALERSMEQKHFQRGLAPCGDHKFVSRSFVTNSSSAVLKDDAITILCKIVLPAATLPLLQANTPQVTEFQGFEHLLETGKFSDVTLVAGEEQFRLHKVILASCSPVFRAMFEHDMKERQSSRVDVEHVGHEVMREVIRFMYTSKVHQMDTLAVELLAVADMYAIVQLKDLCEKALCDRLCIDTALESLTLAIRYNSSYLKIRTIEFIARNLEDFLDLSHFKLLDSSIYIELLTIIAQKKIIV